MNSNALKKLNIQKETKSPEGGKIDFDTGFLEETAFTYYLQKAPMASLESLKKAYLKAQQTYASYGITTAQDGMIVDALKNIYHMLIQDHISVSYTPRCV